MELFTIASIIIALSALFGFINVRFLKLPNTIGLMLIAIVFTLLLFASTLVTDRFLESARTVIGFVDFEEVLMDVMLGFLLFAGALHTNFDQLKVQRWPVLLFSTLGVLCSTFLVGVSVFYGFNALGLEVKFIHCLLFGSLISPTDPIAVLGILKKARVPKKLETKIVGESLFNDGIGVVVFLTLLSIAGGSHHGSHAESEHSGDKRRQIVHAEPDNPEAGNKEAGNSITGKTEAGESAADHPTTGNPANGETAAEDEHASSEDELIATIQSVATLFGVEVFGGIVLGVVLGTATFLLMRSIDDYEIEVLITLACVMGGYSLASYWHLSAPLAMVVAGLIVGNDTVRDSAMSRETELYVDRFWELMDIMLNAILFVLIGLEILVLKVTPAYIYASLFAIVAVLSARYLSLLAPVRFFRKRLDFVPHTLPIMTWGGLRGGISIALALGLPDDMNRDLFLTTTYGVVIFSIIVQGLTVGPLARKLIGIDSHSDAEAAVEGH